MSKSQSYKDLEVYQLAMELAIDIHKMSLTHLPKYEMYEEGSQIRRSSKSIVSNIIEGFGRRRYKNQFVQFITYSLASCDETKGHLEMLYKTEFFRKLSFMIYMAAMKNWRQNYTNFVRQLSKNTTYLRTTQHNHHESCILNREL